MNLLKPITAALLEGKIVEFTLRGDSYLIQQENNKGWDYLGIWQISPTARCIGRALFEIFDGIGPDTVEELLSLPCFDGESLLSLLPELADVNIHK